MAKEKKPGAERSNRKAKSMLQPVKDGLTTPVNVIPYCGLRKVAENPCRHLRMYGKERLALACASWPKIWEENREVNLEEDIDGEHLAIYEEAEAAAAKIMAKKESDPF